MKAQPVSIAKLVNRDVVRNPNDPSTDSFDADANGQLLVDGFDGSFDQNKNVRGLPADGKVSVFQLESYDDANALQLTDQDQQTISLKVEPTSVAAVRFLVASGNGNCTVPIMLEFADGSKIERPLYCFDWFTGFVGFRKDIVCTPCWDGMDRFNNDQLDDANAASLFDVFIPVSQDSPLVRIHFQADQAKYDSPRTRFHLFGVTVMNPAP